jgi:UDP-N-acetylglucosamine--N-acetylmuramyl-(pentapeptide) pyrophosphoryl-undecaprenol N-acetylglucosamine transferase
MERSLVEREGVPFATIHAGALNGVGFVQSVRGVIRLLQGLGDALRLLAGFRPDVVLLTGGFVGVPVAVAAWLRRVPSVVYLPDIEPGLALNLMARFARKVAVTTPESARYIASNKMVVTGYPVRAAFAGVDRDAARRRLGLPSDVPVLLVFGGSRGAQSINRAVVAGIERLAENCVVVQVTGATSWDEVAAAHAGKSENLRERWKIFSYLHEEMVDAMAAADLAVCRAGASALGELPCVGLPAVLVPYPYAWRFQKVNAQYLAGQGAAVMLEDGAMSTDLADQVIGLLQNRDRLSAMRAAAFGAARCDGAQRIAAVVVDVVEGFGRAAT